MAEPSTPTLLIVAQAGRLTYEAILFVASLRKASPDWSGRVVVAEPLPGPLWPGDPGICLFLYLLTPIHIFCCSAVEMLN